jgi:hypothetical protein
VYLGDLIGSHDIDQPPGLDQYHVYDVQNHNLFLAKAPDDLLASHETYLDVVARLNRNAIDAGGDKPAAEDV